MSGPPDFSKSRKSDEKIGSLLQLMKNLNVELGLERSFKVSERILLGNRFLLGTSKSAIGQESHERILDICERMEMPGNLQETFRENLSEANYVHFGFEENVRTCIYKVYLEFYDKIGKEIKSQPHTSDYFLLHLGFKWDVSDNTKHAVTKYTWYPFLSVEEIQARLASILDPRAYGKPLEIAKDIMSTVSNRVTQDKILYLEVSEENNPRRSFDINMYKAGLQLEEILPFLLNMCQHYSIPAEKFHVLYDQVKTRMFGHLSGGIDREGRDFLTVYYGVEGYSIPIQEHESKAGFPGGDILPTAKPDRSPALSQPFPTRVRADQKAILLLQLVKDLNVEYGFERSFKMYKETMLANRFLVGFRRDTIRKKPNETILDICKKIEMPEDFLEAFRENLPETNIVLFGFEENDRTSVVKAYLEFGGRIREALEENPYNPSPFIIHLGFKWDASANTRRTLSRYTCYPAISVQNILDRISDIYDDHKYRKSFDVAKGMVELASSRIGEGEFLYVEVDEENNPRKSFDMNIYRAKLQLTELYPLLLKMCHHYSIRSEEFHLLYDSVKTQIFGHLSGGIDREGRDFLTVYFREKGIPQ
jgi:hypothetical protein